jgi:hypothetical protein
MRIDCPNCETTLEVADSRSGEQVFCHGCGIEITAPPGMETRSPAAPVAPTPGDEKICPMCGATIKAIARKCRFCGENVIGVSGPDSRPGHGLWRDQNLLVMAKGAQLPFVCVKTNQPADQWLRRKLYWHSPWIYLLVLLSLWIYIIVALIVRQKGDIQIGLCREQLVRRRWAIAGGWLGGLAGIALMIVGLGNQQSPEFAWGVGVLGLVVSLGSLISGLLVSRIVAPTRITKQHIWLKGVNLSYLGALPAFPGED